MQSNILYPSNSSTKGELLLEVSLLRCLATVSVVIFHSMCFYGIWDPFFGNHAIPFIQSIATWLNYINMPLFVFLSGYVFSYSFYKRNKEWNIVQLLKEKTLRLLVPFVVWGSLQCLLFPKFCRMSLFASFLHLWFLQMLFGIFVLVVLSKSLWQKKLFSYVLLLLFLLLEFLDLSNTVLSTFNIANSFKFFPMFLIGLIAYRDDWLTRYSESKFRILLLLIMVLTAMILLIKSTNFTQILFAIPSILILMSISKKYAPLLIQNRIWGGVKLVDKCSMGIYLIHHIIIWIVIIYTPVQIVAPRQPLMTIILLFILSFCGALLLTCFMKHYKILKYLIG